MQPPDLRSFSVDDAIELVMERAQEMCATELVEVEQSLARYVAGDLFARCDQPRFESAAMDGWAVSGDRGPFRIVGESRGGAGYAHRLSAGEAVMISTGAPLPEGATSLVRRENGSVKRERLVAPSLTPDRDIRSRGSDFLAGSRLVTKGKRIDFLDIALLSAAGTGKIDVYKRPTVNLLATGDEIVPADTAALPFSNYDAVSPAAAVRLGQAGCEVRHLGIATDNLDDIASRFVGARGSIVVVVGGASNGRHDLVRAALAPLGLSILIPSVMMRPGKPFWFGRLEDGRFVAGLPGNPIAALIALELFVLSAIRAMQGMVAPLTWTAYPPLDDAGGAQAHDWMRFAKWSFSVHGLLNVELKGTSDSAAIYPSAGANAIVRRRGGKAYISSFFT